MTAVALVAATLGALVALGVVRLRAAPPAPPTETAAGLPDSVAGVLAAVGGPAVVLDVADEVVRASPAAHARLAWRDSLKSNSPPPRSRSDASLKPEWTPMGTQLRVP